MHVQICAYNNQEKKKEMKGTHTAVFDVGGMGGRKKQEKRREEEERNEGEFLHDFLLSGSTLVAQNPS